MAKLWRNGLNRVKTRQITGQKDCTLDFECVCRQWLDLTARVLMGSCVQSGGWDHPVYTSIYPVYYIPRSRHGAASHISQTSGFLHLVTSGQQPDTSSTPSAFTGVHKCWWRRLISKYQQHSVAWDQAPAAAAKCVQKIAQI